MARGPFFINSFTPNETTEKALDLTLEVLKRLHEKGISEIDLNSAKTYIKGQFPTELETTDQLAATIAELEFFGLDEREIDTRSAKLDAMTVGDAKRIIQQYFPLENLVFVLIGKAAEIELVVKKYAPTMDRKSILEPGSEDLAEGPDKSLGPVFAAAIFNSRPDPQWIHVLKSRPQANSVHSGAMEREAAPGAELSRIAKLESLGLSRRSGHESL